MLVWADARSSAALQLLQGRGRADLPESLRVTEFAGIVFSGDGGSVFVGLRPWERSEAGDDDEPDSGGDDEGDSEGGDRSDSADEDVDGVDGDEDGDDDVGNEP